MTTNRSHADCDHPRTSAARARCRAGKIPTPAAIVEVAKAEAMIKSIAFERETCDRCGGSGQYPSAMWQGMCLKCEGKGRMLTRTGKAALKRWNAIMSNQHSKLAHELEPGDLVMHSGRRVKVHDVDHKVETNGRYMNSGVWITNYTMSYTTKRADGTPIINMVDPRADIQLYPQGETLQAAMRSIAHLKGCIVTYED